MAFRQITFGSADYRKECELRHEVLRAPLGLSLYDEDLSREQQQMHFGLFEQNNQLVACVIAVAVSSSEAKIRQMAVARDHQGKGHGRSIINSLEEHLAQQGYRHLSMHARVSAIGFYEKLGYARAGDEFEEVGIPHVQMGKAIQPANATEANQARI